MKAAKSHREKRDYRAFEAWKKRKKELNTLELKKIEQKYWRKDCISARAFAGTITEKNIAEAKRLGFQDYSTPE